MTFAVAVAAVPAIPVADIPLVVGDAQSLFLLKILNMLLLLFVLLFLVHSLGWILACLEFAFGPVLIQLCVGVPLSGFTLHLVRVCLSLIRVCSRFVQGLFAQCRALDTRIVKPTTSVIFRGITPHPLTCRRSKA